MSKTGRGDTNKLPKNNPHSVASLKSCSLHECWATKRGGKVASWKNRFFMLVPGQINPKAAEFYYFTSDKAKFATGVITITEKSSVKQEAITKDRKKTVTCISISSGVLGSRIFYLYCDSQKAQDDCVKALTNKIKQLQDSSTPINKPVITTLNKDPGPAKDVPPAGAASPAKPNDKAKVTLKSAKDSIPTALSETANDFWEIWTTSIPASASELALSLSTTPDMSELTWRVIGPQQSLIQEMVDFFWNVGAPDEEIDKLNNIGGVINPAYIGSWIDMSTLGGMDGGWIFPGDMAINDALEACDEGEARSKLENWLKNNGIANGILLARDMGASPPRQTEIRISLTFDFTKNYETIVSALKSFSVPEMPSDYSKALKKWQPTKVELSVVTSSEGFVRIGLIFPNPTPEIVEAIAGHRPFMDFQKNIKKEASFIEIQYLMPGFGYAVYQEGYKIKLHYALL